MPALEISILVASVAASVALFLYGLNAYVLLALYRRGRRGETGGTVSQEGSGRTEHGAVRVDGSRACAAHDGSAGIALDWPVVTVQLPVYNERFVVGRLLQAAVDLDYPRDRLEIQLLDDSDDETAELAAGVVARYRRAGARIVHLRRRDRAGFKAGALAAGLEQARGEFVAIFDADFVPPPEFLRRSVPPLLADAGLALVQARWGHLNREHSFLTRAQAVGIDGHFVIEQNARSRSGLFLNFNGTAGVWRRSAIQASGGWQADTLTEDLDLSYRAQLAGWRLGYLGDLVAPAELPIDVNGLKSQQYRWAKGSIQTARKLLPRVFRAPIPWFNKIQAFFHLTHYLIHPLILVSALFALPVLRIDLAVSEPLLVVIGGCLILSTLSPSVLYGVSQREAYPDWGRRLWILPLLVAVGVGIAVNNTRAVFAALLGASGEFVRTPKYGLTRGPHPSSDASGAPRTDAAVRRRIYRIGPHLSVILELLLAVYGFHSLKAYAEAGRWAAVPFLVLSATGFLLVGLLSLWHGWRSQPSAEQPELVSAP